MFRNNVGVLKDITGRPVRFGLANDSAQINKVLKSGDLIGIDPVLITQDMVGKTIGQFVSIEVKHIDWIFSGNAHESAQQAWIDLVVSYGGKAFFANNAELIEL